MVGHGGAAVLQHDLTRPAHAKLSQLAQSVAHGAFGKNIERGARLITGDTHLPGWDELRAQKSEVHTAAD